MARVIEGWLLSNDGFNFRRNPSYGCGDMGIGVSGSRGEYFIEMWLWFFGLETPTRSIKYVMYGTIQYYCMCCSVRSVRYDMVKPPFEWSNTWSTARAFFSIVA